jgi:hypothetical protein
MERVLTIVAEAIAEVSTGQALNQVASAGLRSSLEDAILYLDSEAFGAEVVFASGGEPSPFTGTLPSRATSGKLQRVRQLRAALLGSADAGGTTVGAMDVLLRAATVE